MPDPDSATTGLPEWIPLLLMVVGVVFLGVFFMLSIRAKVARRHAAAPDPRERIEEIKGERRATEGLHAAAAEYLDTTQRLAAQLDNKAQRLELLLEDADRAIAELRALARDRADRPPSISASDPPRASAPAAAPSRPARAEALDALTRSVYELSDAGTPPLEIARRLDEQIGKVELILALRER